jgi:hypothetical protein
MALRFRIARRIGFGALLALAGCQLVAGLEEPLPSPSPSGDAAAGQDGAVTGDATSDDPYQREVLRDKPVAYYPLDAANGRNTPDLSGHGQPGLLAGSYRLEGGAVHFDGIDGVLSLGDRFDFPGPASVTFEMWVKTDGGTGQRIFGKTILVTGAGPSGTQLIVGREPEYRVGFQRFGQAGQLRAACHSLAASFDDGKMHHVVVVMRAGDPLMYVDAVDVRLIQPAGSSLPCFDKPTEAHVSENDSPMAWGGFVGSLDEVAVYDHALTGERVAAHYAARSAP